MRWQWRRPMSDIWRVDETYIKVRGKWTYLYRAVDKLGNTIDFYLSSTRNAKAAKRFLGKALKGCKDWEKPSKINMDKAGCYTQALRELKEEGKCPKDLEHRHRGRPRQTETTYQASARIQNDENRLRHDQWI